MQQNKKVLLLLNKNARNGTYNQAAIIATCEGYGISPFVPDGGNDLSLGDTIRRHAHHCDLVIIGGGDGTLNLAAKALMETELPLGILPLGTANNLARTLGITPDVKSTIHPIARGKTRKIDLGEVNHHFFFNISRIGFSASLARSLTSQMKRKWGSSAMRLLPLKSSGRAVHSAPPSSMTA